MLLRTAGQSGNRLFFLLRGLSISGDRSSVRLPENLETSGLGGLGFHLDFARWLTAIVLFGALGTSSFCSLIVTTDRPSVGNSGVATITFTAEVSDPGAQAGTASVTGDLTAIGGPTAFTLAKASESGDNKQATFTASYTIPKTAVAGKYDLPFTGSLGGRTFNAFVSQSIFRALSPLWTQMLDGGILSSPVVNGTTVYVGTTEPSVYALDAASGGAPVSSFGINGKVHLDDYAVGRLLIAVGRLYVPANTFVVALDPDSGAILATSQRISNPRITMDEVLSPGFLYVGGNDGKVHKLDADSLVEVAATTFPSSGIVKVAIGPSAVDPSGIIVAGNVDGKIMAIKASDMTPAFGNAVIGTDSPGEIQGNPVFATLGATTNVVGIGGPSGFWGFNADTGQLLGDETNSWGTASGQAGNPYRTNSPVVGYASSGLGGANYDIPVFVYSTEGDANSGGQVNIITVADGQRVSLAGLPVTLTKAGTGVSAIGGVLYVVGGGTSYVFTGTDEGWLAGRFFAVETNPQDDSYAATPAIIAIFDPGDTVTFPGYEPGSFYSAPAVAGDVIVVGGASQVFGFPNLVSQRTTYVYADVELALRLLGGLVTSTATVSQRLDQDDDRRITITDVSRIMRKVAGSDSNP